MSKLPCFSLLLINYFIILCMCEPRTKERIDAVKRYLEELDNSVDKSTWVNPNDIFNNNPKILNGFVEKVKNNFVKSIEETNVYDLNQNENKESEKQNVKSKKQYDTSNITNEPKMKDVASIENTKEEIVMKKHKNEAESILNTNYLKDQLNPDRNSNINSMYLLRWFKMFLNKCTYTGTADKRQIISIFIDNQDLKKIHSLTNLETLDINNVDSIISKVLSHITVSEEQNFVIEIIIDYWRHIFLTITVIGVVALCIYLYPKVTFYTSLVLICIIWQYVNLYQKAVAEKHAALETIHFPSACKKHELSMSENFHLWITGFIQSHGTCEDYYKSIMVDPLWEITPLMAISAAISKFIFYPVEVFAETANKFTLKLFKGLSLFHSVLIILILIYLLMLLFNYRLCLTYFFRIEPAQISTSHNTVTANENTNMVCEKEENCRNRKILDTVDDKCVPNCYDTLPICEKNSNNCQISSNSNTNCVLQKFSCSNFCDEHNFSKEHHTEKANSEYAPSCKILHLDRGDYVAKNKIMKPIFSSHCQHCKASLFVKPTACDTITSNTDKNNDIYLSAHMKTSKNVCSCPSVSNSTNNESQILSVSDLTNDKSQTASNCTNDKSQTASDCTNDKSQTLSVSDCTNVKSDDQSTLDDTVKKAIIEEEN